MKFKNGMMVLGIGIVMLALSLMLTVSVNANAFQSPLVTQTPTATAQPEPEPEPDPGNGNDGTLEFPDVDFNVTVIAIIAGLVQYFKELGVTGKGSLTTSIVLGLLLGGGDFLAANGTPSDFAGWFGVLIVGLAYGLSTSGLYLLAKTHRPGTVS